MKPVEGLLKAFAREISDPQLGGLKKLFERLPKGLSLIIFGSKMASRELERITSVICSQAQFISGSSPKMAQFGSKMTEFGANMAPI